MGEERSTDNPQAAAMPKNTKESYSFQLKRIINSLARYDDDPDSIIITRHLRAAVDWLERDVTEPEPTAGTSPGKDDKGDPLAPFSPMSLPERTTTRS